MHKKILMLLLFVFWTVPAFAQEDLWTRTYGGSGEDEGYSVQQTTDGGYIVTGGTQSFGAGGGDVYLVKTDSNGDTLWTRTYGGGSDDRGRSVQQTTDGGYIVAGYTYSFGAGWSDVYLIKTDSLGNTLWTRTYGGNGGGIGHDWGYSVQQTTDSGYIVTGITYSFGAGLYDVYLIKTNSTGDTLWTRTYGASHEDEGYSVQQTTDGGYIVAGRTNSFEAGSPDVYLIKTNSTGDILWNRTYGGSSGEDEGYSVQQTTDEGYIVAGHTWSFGAGRSDVYLIKTNSTGDTLWTRTYGGSSWDEGYSVQQTTDGGYILAGWTYSFGAGAVDVMLTKLDSLGNTCIGEFVSSTVMSVSPTVTSPATVVETPATIVTSTPTTVTSPPTEIHIVCTAQPPSVISTSPTQNELNVPISTNISVTFDVDMDETTINDSAFVVNARCTGLHPGTIKYDGPSRTATFDPLMDFDDGEVVTVVLTTGIQSSGGVPLDSAYMWSFTSVVYDGSGTFGPHSVYAAGNGPFSVFAADLDGDGGLDLATASYLSDSVSVLLNYGDGTFAPDSVYPAGDGPMSVFAGDLDGDGDLDLATANHVSENISVLLNNGDGTFAPHSVYPIGVGPGDVFAADLDGDGDLDLAAANSNSDNVSVLLNNGDGTFAPHSMYPVGSSPKSVFAADLDADGDLDLATANSSAPIVSVLLNNGDGTFAPHSVYPVGDGSFSVFAGDLDGDGDLDLATANGNSDNVSVLLNNGDGSFTPHSVYAVGEEPFSVFAADLDGDGALDLATANWASVNVSVLLNIKDYDVLVTPGYDTSGSASSDVVVRFYIQNTGDSLDTYDVNVTDSLGWNVDPSYYEITLSSGQLDSVPFTVSIPDVPIGTKNRIFVTAVSQTYSSVRGSASLTVTCDGYNVKIAEISDVGNDQGKQVRVEWTSFPGSDPLVTDFTIFRRIDPLLFALPAQNPGFFSGKDYPPGEWDMIGTYEAFGETLYSAVVPTLKDSSIAEGMYWSVFFIRAGTDDPIVYFDSPVDSGYSLDNLSPSPPVGLLASHEPAVTKLTWGAIPDVDFDYFTVYRDTSSGFTPGPNSRLGYTIDSVFVDSTAELGRTYYYLASATDFSGNESDPSNEAMAVRYNAGDANGDGIINVGDVVYLVSYLYRNGPAPSPVEAGDCNCDDIVNVGDVVYLVSYLYRNGPPPAC